MKNKMFKFGMVAAMLLLITIPFKTANVFAATEQSVLSFTSSSEATKYPAAIMAVARIYLGVDASSNAVDDQINSMPKTQVMDIYLASEGNTSDGQIIRDGVDAIFNISLDTISEQGEGSFLLAYPSEIMEGVRATLTGNTQDTSVDPEIMSLPKAEVMDKFLSSYGTQISGVDTRRVINEIFGVNLNGISAFEHARLSIYSKGQWVLQSPNDVFIISSNKGDIDIYVGVTDYYTANLGTNQLPADLQTYLTGLGFVYDSSLNLYDYHNPTGQSVSDAFKSQVIGTLVAYIQEHYSNL